MVWLWLLFLALDLAWGVHLFANLFSKRGLVNVTYVLKNKFYSGISQIYIFLSYEPTY